MAVAVADVSRPAGNRAQQQAKSAGMHVLIVVYFVVSIFPFAWIAGMSLKQPADVVADLLGPGGAQGRPDDAAGRAGRDCEGMESPDRRVRPREATCRLSRGDGASAQEVVFAEACPDDA